MFLTLAFDLADRFGDLGKFDGSKCALNAAMTPLPQVLASPNRVNWWHIFGFTLPIPVVDTANVPGKV